MMTSIPRSAVAERVHAARRDAQRVDVEAGVRLVEDRELRVEERHLEDLVALLLAAREALVDGAVQEGLLHLDELRLLVEEREEVDRVELGVAAVPADGVDGRAEEVGVRDAGDLDRVLEREEHALARALLGRHAEEVPAQERRPSPA